jgi:hypothetical protein
MGDLCEFDARAGRMFEELLRRTHLSTADELAAIVAEEARAVGVESLVVYLIDYEPRLLVPVPAPDASGRQPLPVLGDDGWARVREHVHPGARARGDHRATRRRAP